jgi:hypothetical protein
LIPAKRLNTKRHHNRRGTPFVGRGGSETDDQTKDRTENRQKTAAHYQVRYALLVDYGHHYDGWINIEIEDDDRLDELVAIPVKKNTSGKISEKKVSQG